MSLHDGKKLRNARAGRSQSVLSNKLARSLAGYAAASMGATLAFPSANAAIVYTKVDVPIEGAYNLVMGNTTVLQFRERPYLQDSAFLRASVPNSNGVIGASGKLVTNLKLGSAIGTQETFTGGIVEVEGAFNRITDSGSYDAYLGNFKDTTGFIGVKFEKAGKTHYGWARVRVNVYVQPPFTYSLRVFGTLIDYAYEAVPNTPIAAGQGIPSGNTEAGPVAKTPASLGLLAYGSEALSAWR